MKHALGRANALRFCKAGESTSNCPGDCETQWNRISISATGVVPPPAKPTAAAEKLLINEVSRTISASSSHRQSSFRTCAGILRPRRRMRTGVRLPQNRPAHWATWRRSVARNRLLKRTRKRSTVRSRSMWRDSHADRAVSSETITATNRFLVMRCRAMPRSQLRREHRFIESEENRRRRNASAAQSRAVVQRRSPENRRQQIVGKPRIHSHAAFDVRAQADLRSITISAPFDSAKKIRRQHDVVINIGRRI